MAEPSAYEQDTSLDRALRRLPVWAHPAVERMLSRWPGRVLYGIATSAIRVELFDRSMAVAAQFFTSVFPTLILIGSVVDDYDQVADAIEMPQATAALLDDAFEQSSNAAFGVVGALIVLASATSLSRALTRAFAAIWMLPRPSSRLTAAWRWVTVVLVFALSIVLIPVLSRYAGELPPATFWRTLTTLPFDVALAVFIPWLLLAGRVPRRHLLLGGFVFGTVMLFLRPAAATWLPQALELSFERYGSIGVAFSYLAWLYVIAFALLASSVAGQVVTSDPGRLGAWIRGERHQAPAAG